MATPNDDNAVTGAPPAAPHFAMSSQQSPSGSSESTAATPPPSSAPSPSSQGSDVWRAPPHGYYPAKIPPVVPLPPYQWPPLARGTPNGITAAVGTQPATSA
ncbi:hypothetical protein BV25DRAFT_1843697 [Artomyces pyxidatus]|uniref:Uncharacterized protein n=1 Tax=Artomyces pyxidatus TaxID=48021 RepID=A0ACB8SDN6_9AGAM|nr:hypothetical protein BV25DRAFT_1843697 [Artomyces pyxidatus]